MHDLADDASPSRFLFIRASISPKNIDASAQRIITSRDADAGKGTHGIYLIPASSNDATVSVGNVPVTFIAYVPGTYPSNRCQRATQLCRSSMMDMRPSKTWDVHSWIASLLPRSWRTCSQLGQPSRANFLNKTNVSNRLYEEMVRGLRGAYALGHND